MIFVGIDPGLSGAIAAVNSKGKLLGVWDTPIVENKKVTKKRTGKTTTKSNRAYLPATMVQLIKDLQTHVDTNGLRSTRKLIIGIEQVHAMPNNGAIAGFSLGRGSGLWEGIAAALGLPLETVPPQRWKKEMLGSGAGNDKGISIARAQALMPSSAKYLTRKKDDGRAEAILIALYFQRLYQQRCMTTMMAYPSA